MFPLRHNAGRLPRHAAARRTQLQRNESEPKDHDRH